MRWLLGTVLTLSIAGLWAFSASALGVPAVMVGHVGGVICAAGSTLACGGKLWA